MARIISVIGWKKFQHYKDRDPPWVKLYRDLLTTESWVLGTDLSRLVQVASVLLAARYSNQIPYLWDLIRKVSHLGCSEEEFDAAVEHLVRGEFLEIHEVTSSLAPSVASCNQHASNTLSTCSSEESREEQSREDAREGVDYGRPGADPEPTPAASVCLAMKTEGLTDGNSAHPELLALLSEGAGIGEFAQAARDAIAKGKGFAYALGTVRNRRTEAARRGPTGLDGPLPRKAGRRDESPYREPPDAFDVARRKGLMD